MRDELVKRADECKEVVDNLEQTRAWQVIQADLLAEEEVLNNSWHNIYDEKKLKAARVLKNAIRHILDLKQKYAQERDQLLKEIEETDNPDKYIQRDYDTETNYE